MKHLQILLVTASAALALCRPAAAATVSCPHADPSDLSGLTAPTPTPDTADCAVVVAGHRVRIEGRWIGTRSLAGGGSYRFNERGQLLEVIDGGGNANAVTPTRQITSVTTSNGGATQFLYDPLGRLLTVTGPAGLNAAFTYSASGRIASITNAAAQVVQYVYDSTGHLTTLFQNGAATTFSYGDGRIVSVSDAGGTTTVSYLAAELTQISAGGSTIIFSYDVDGRLTSVINPQGMTTYAYGPELSSVATPAGTTTYSYGTAGELIHVADPAGGTTTYTYQDGRIESRQAPDGSLTTFTYDALGRPLTVTDVSGQTLYTYNAAGNLTSISRPAGDSIAFAYASGVLSVTCAHADPSDLSALGPPTPSTGTGDCQRDVLSSNLRVSDGRWSRSGDLAGGGSYRLNDSGALLEVTDAGGNVVVIPAGRRLAKVIDFTGRTTRFTYDVLGRVLTAVTPRSTTTYTYLNGRIVQAAGNGGATYQFLYDSGQRLIGVVNPVNAQASATITSAGHVSAITDAMGTTFLSYSAGGALLSITGSSGRVVSFGYDQLGRLTTVNDPAGRSTSYAYDNENHVVSITAPAGNQNYSYAAGGLLVSTSGPEGVTSYLYSNGLLTSILSAIAVTYGYDADGHLTSVQSPLGNIAFTYDTTGTVISVTDRRSRTTSFVYDDGTPPTLHLPASIMADATTTAGAAVSYTVTATDDSDPEPAVQCAPTSGSTFTVGTTTVTCTATDAGGNQSSGTFVVTVRYATSGLLRPFEPGDGAAIKIGSTLPVKFRLGGGSSSIVNLSARFYYAKAGEPFTDGGLFKYDAINNQYVVNWSTKNLPAGIYTVKVDLGGGQVITAQVTLLAK